jgi:competence protein ComEC
VRAFLMVAVLEAAHVLRRPCNPIAALAASALPTLLADPLDTFGASFRMSYSVVAAILCLGLPFSAFLRRRFPPFRYLPEVSWSLPQRAVAFLANHLVSAAGVGVPAALVSALTGIEFFGVLTPCGLVSNLLVVPLASLVIVAGCLTLVIPDPGGHAALLFNHAAGLLLGLIERILALIGAIPGAWMPAHFREPWIGPASLALLLATVLGGYAWGWSSRRGGWSPPFVVVALTLAAGVRYG